jgi:hypothetical protein
VTRREALDIIAAHRDELYRRGVGTLALFGSVARDEAADGSDVDLLVEFAEPVGLFEFLDLKEFLESILGHQVDLVPRSSIKRQLKDQILAEAVDAA